MEHHFNTIVATKYGVNEAIFCHNLYFWIKKNQANKKHIYDGNVWTYNTMEAFTQLFPYWTLKQIRTIISNCEKKNLIVKGNYNLKGYDRTIWYSLSDVIFEIYEGKTIDIPHMPKKAIEETQELPKRANASAHLGTPIPDSKPDNKQIKKEEEEEAPQLTDLTDFFLQTIDKTAGKQYIKSLFAEQLQLLPYEVIKKQLEICAKKGGKSWSYVQTALERLQESNVVTIEQLEQKLADHKNSNLKKPSRGQSKQKRTENLPSWYEDSKEYYEGGAAAEKINNVENPDIEAKKEDVNSKLASLGIKIK